MCTVKKGVLRNFTKLTGKHRCQGLLFNKVSGRASNFVKKETLAQVFSCEFYEISKNTFFTEHLRTTASVIFPFSSGSFLYSLQVTLIKGGVKFWADWKWLIFTYFHHPSNDEIMKDRCNKFNCSKINSIFCLLLWCYGKKAFQKRYTNCFL